MSDLWYIFINMIYKKNWQKFLRGFGQPPLDMDLLAALKWAGFLIEYDHHPIFI